MEEKKNQRSILVYAGIALVLIIVGAIFIPKLLQNQKTNQPSSHYITLTKTGFEPNELTIKKGDVVVWTNNSGKQASVNSINYPDHQMFPFLNLGPFENGQTLNTPFPEPGGYGYVNHLNPDDIGTITVTE